MGGPILSPQTPRLSARPMIKQSVSPPPLPSQSQYMMTYIHGVLHDEESDVARRWRDMPPHTRNDISARLQSMLPYAMSEFMDGASEIWSHPTTWARFQEATMGLISLIPALELENERLHRAELHSRHQKGRERRTEPPLYKSVLVSRAQTIALRRSGPTTVVIRLPSGGEDPFADP